LLRVLRLHAGEDVECEAESVSMATVYNERLNGENERTRIEKLEMFDEFEEWTMLQNHYCLSLGKRLPSGQIT
jgi:tRNA wybutosine-synthesizing protein 4